MSVEDLAAVDEDAAKVTPRCGMIRETASPFKSWHGRPPSLPKNSPSLVSYLR